MLPPKSLGLLLVASVYAAATHQTLSNLYDACEFTLGRSRYDLCPLFHDRGHDGIVKVRAELSPTTQSYYEISFGGPLKTQGEGEAEPQCPPGTWICLRERRDHPGESGSHFTQAIPIVGGLSIGTPHTTRASRPEVDAYHNTHKGELEIDLKEVMWRNERRAVHFHFICDQHAQEPSLPAFVDITAGTHNFEWSTPHACAKESPGFGILGENNGPTPPGEEALPEGDGNQDLVDDRLPVYHTSRILVVALAAASTAMLGLGYLIRYPPPLLKRWVGTTAKKLPFRAGEGVLVQWAEEAIFINGEEDVMVNYEEQDDTDEYIPLKPSPTRLYARYMDYGSARR